MSLIPWSHMNSDITPTEIHNFLQEMMKDLRKGDKIKNMLFARHETAGSFVSKTLLREYPPTEAPKDNLACQISLLSSAITGAFRDRHMQQSQNGSDFTSSCLTATLCRDPAAKAEAGRPPKLFISNEKSPPQIDPDLFLTVAEEEVCDKARIGLISKDQLGKMWLVWISRAVLHQYSKPTGESPSARRILSLRDVGENYKTELLSSKQTVWNSLLERFVQRIDQSNRHILKAVFVLFEFYEAVVSKKKLDTKVYFRPPNYPSDYTLETELAYIMITLLNLVGGLRALNTVIATKSSPAGQGFIQPLEAELDLIDARAEVVHLEIRKLQTVESSTAHQHLNMLYQRSMQDLKEIVSFHLKELYKNPQQSFLIGPFTIIMQSGQIRVKNFLQTREVSKRDFHLEVLASILKSAEGDKWESLTLTDHEIAVTADFAVGWRAVLDMGMGALWISRTMNNLICNILMEKYYFLDNYRQDDHLIQGTSRLPPGSSFALALCEECNRFLDSKNQLFRFYSKL